MSKRTETLSSIVKSWVLLLFVYQYFIIIINQIVLLLVMDREVNEIELSVPRREFYEEWLKHAKKDKNNRLFDYFSIKFDLSRVTPDSLRNFKRNIARISGKLLEKWVACGRKQEVFGALPLGVGWLTSEKLKFTIQYYIQPSTSSFGCDPPQTSGPGRPRIDFNDASFKTKKRRVEHLVKSCNDKELGIAAEVSTRLSGHRDAANIIKSVTQTPAVATEIKKKMTASISAQRCLSSEEALAYYVEAKCTSYTYMKTRKWALKTGHDVYPSYIKVQAAKKLCYPPNESLFINETRAEVKLQAILNKTAERLLLAQSEVVETLTNPKLKLISKWGCDGSSGYSTYKQKFTNSNDTDEFLFAVSFVPLRLCEGDKIVWQNPRPSSTMYCRPIKLIFSKENTELIVTESNKICEEIRQLLPSICVLNGKEYSVEHEMLLTMIDGKVCNALTENSSTLRCYLCGLTAKYLNDVNMDYTVDPDKVGFGFSTLHALMRCFECMLHISYRLDIKKWQARGAEDKMSVQQRSNIIRQAFKEKIGLIIDKPKPGYGTTNDGNTARKFFENPELSAEITGLDVNLLRKFSILLKALSSGYDINFTAFENFARETRLLYLSLYSWYFMSPTVHKILVHSTDIIKHYILPIGQLSEEAQEARNKDCRRFREHHTRKCSRTDSNFDMLSMLLITSDPVINSLREVPKKKLSKLSPEVLALIMPPKVKTTNFDDDVESDDEESSEED